MAHICKVKKIAFFLTEYPLLPLKTMILSYGEKSNMTSMFYSFFKAEKSGTVHIFEFCSKVVIFTMIFAEKFNDFKAAFVDIKIKIAPPAGTPSPVIMKISLLQSARA